MSDATGSTIPEQIRHRQGLETTLLDISKTTVVDGVGRARLYDYYNTINVAVATCSAWRTMLAGPLVAAYLRIRQQRSLTAPTLDLYTVLPSKERQRAGGLDTTQIDMPFPGTINSSLMPGEDTLRAF